MLNTVLVQPNALRSLISNYINSFYVNRICLQTFQQVYLVLPLAASNASACQHIYSGNQQLRPPNFNQ